MNVCDLLLIILCDGIETLLILGFVNAQYRFVMNPTGDYTVHFADPDMYVDVSITSIFS